MRKNKQSIEDNGIKVLIVDDEIGIIDSLSIFLKRYGYNFTGVTNPLEAIEKVKNEQFDLMILDFIMTPIHGDKVVEEIRKFNKELYILLLTGHKDLAPPLETIRRLDIQGYCEKNDRFDQLLHKCRTKNSKNKVRTSLFRKYSNIEIHSRGKRSIYKRAFR